MKSSVVLRVARHPLDSDRFQFLQAVYGHDIKVVTEDISYGDDPVTSVRALIERTEADVGKVVALEAQAPFQVLMRLVDNRRQLGIALIRAQFERDESGRAVVCGKDEGGRDLLQFSHYEELEKIEFQTRRLESRQ